MPPGMPRSVVRRTLERQREACRDSIVQGIHRARKKTLQGFDCPTEDGTVGRPKLPSS